MINALLRDIISGQSINMFGLVKRILGIKRPAPPPYPGAIIGGPVENVHVGERVSFGGNVILHADNSIEIGSDTMIARGAVILTVTHYPENHPMWAERVDRPVTIGKHVWIGVNAIILPGVKVGDYAIVGAGAVVTAHIPERAVVGGNPARIIRFRDANIIDVSKVDINAYPGTIRKASYLPAERICRRKNEDNNGGTGH